WFSISSILLHLFAVIIYKEPILAFPFLGGSKSREGALRASGTPQKNKVVGHCLPTPRGHTLSLHDLPIFAPNHVVTEFCFWYSVSLLKKTKSSGELLWVGVGEILIVGEESECPATLGPVQQHPWRAPGVQGPDHSRHCPPVLWRPALWAQFLGPLDPDPEAGGDCSQQAPPTGSHAAPRQEGQVPAASQDPPPSTSPTSPQRGPTLSFRGRASLPQMCPNTLHGKNQNPKNQKKPNTLRYRLC
uniref:Uncharacterized protein n=1 Tax=Mustela putorius furo TaxID=9669 RepID=M3Z4T6_MUSPF